MRMDDGIQWAPPGWPISFEPPKTAGETDGEVSAEEQEAQRAADLRAFELAIKRIRPTLVASALMLLKSVDDAEDVVQDATVKAWTRGDLFHCAGDADRFEACVLKKVRGRALNKLRGSARKGQFLGRLAVLPRRKREGDDPFRQTLVNEFDRDVYDAAQELSDGCRVVFEHVNYVGLKHSQVAEMLDISINTVRWHLTRANAHVRKRLLAKYGPDVFRLFEEEYTQ